MDQQLGKRNLLTGVPDGIHLPLAHVEVLMNVFNGYG